MWRNGKELEELQLNEVPKNPLIINEYTPPKVCFEDTCNRLTGMMGTLGKCHWSFILGPHFEGPDCYLNSTVQTSKWNLALLLK